MEGFSFNAISTEELTQIFSVPVKIIKTRYWINKSKICYGSTEILKSSNQKFIIFNS